MRTREEQIADIVSCLRFDNSGFATQTLTHIAEKFIEEAEERAKSVPVSSMDTQVSTAAHEMTDEQKKLPEWVWLSPDTKEMSFSRWSRISGNHAPYIRADLFLTAERHAEQRVRAEIAKRHTWFYMVDDPESGHNDMADMLCETKPFEIVETSEAADIRIFFAYQDEDGEIHEFSTREEAEQAAKKAIDAAREVG